MLIIVGCSRVYQEVNNVSSIIFKQHGFCSPWRSRFCLNKKSKKIPLHPHKTDHLVILKLVDNRSSPSVRTAEDSAASIKTAEDLTESVKTAEDSQADSDSSIKTASDAERGSPDISAAPRKVPGMVQWTVNNCLWWQKNFCLTCRWYGGGHLPQVSDYCLGLCLVATYFAGDVRASQAGCNRGQL